MMDRSALTVIEGDARLADTHIQQALGYGRINDLHRIIKKHEQELGTYGEVFCRSGKEPGSGSKGGRPTLTYYLNEAQATLVCMFARTERAAEARRLIVEVFTAWRKGQLDQLPTPVVDPFAVAVGRAAHVVQHGVYVGDMDDLYLRITHLPVWKNGRRPDWWRNLGVRKLITECHRQMRLQDCIRLCEEQTGVRLAGSTLQRYWALLDKVRGPIPIEHAPSSKGRVA